MLRMALQNYFTSARAIGQWRMSFELVNTKSGYRAKHTKTCFPCTASSMKSNNVQQCSFVPFCEYSLKAIDNELRNGQKVYPETKSLKGTSSKDFVAESDKTELSTTEANKIESETVQNFRNRGKDMFDRKFEVRRKDLEDIDEVTDFVLKHFTKRNPVREIFRANKDEQDCYSVERQRVITELEHNYTLGCYEKSSGKLVALIFGTAHDKRIEAIPRIHDNLSTNAVLTRFLAWMKRDLYETLKTKKFLMYGIGAVHPDYTGFGIMVHLGSLLEDLAFENGCEYAVAMTVARYMQIGSEKMGYSVLREVKYEDYVDPVTGLKPDLDLSPIHTHAKVFYLRLNSIHREKKR